MKRRRRDRRQRMTVAAPLPDLPRLRPKLTMLDRADCLQIHRAACEILRRTGVQVYSRPGLELLREAGAVIVDNLAKIPPSLVEWALASAPSAFNLYSRATDNVAVQLDGQSVYFGPGSDTLRYLDPRSGQRRDFQLADIADCIRLCDALPEIGFVMSVGIPRDVPGQTYFRHQFAAMLRHTTKPIVFVCDGLADIEAITAMAAAVAGGMDRLTQYPNILLYSEPSTPLQHSREATDKLLFCAEHALPITHSPAPMIGGTAPITLAGAVALGNAELLSSLVMHQLKNPGAPFLYGHGVHHLDMKEMISVYGAPEFQLARVMAAEMGRFYSLPVWGYTGHTDSKGVDAQAAADAQFSALVALLAKTNLNHDVGYVESGLANSPELMVLTNEIISMTRRFVEGVRVDDEALALDVIDDVGPGGQFLNHDHTMAHWRELWLPQIFDRQRLEAWQEQGSKYTNDRLREVTVSLMDDHEVDPLPGSVEQEIEQILRA
ncbi:MAG: trimethylamine methyltransferase family protein [Anaerolineaceae bacterium]|nr:trimethylamine methyltransferase family protein [Anaerolineaceae bacterium]MCB9099538.1 trimethylamine methyltransferase family protein [Anaerolineales bacterium]